MYEHIGQKYIGTPLGAVVLYLYNVQNLKRNPKDLMGLVEGNKKDMKNIFLSLITDGMVVETKGALNIVDIMIYDKNDLEKFLKQTPYKLTKKGTAVGSVLAESADRVTSIMRT